jgi:uncharacterized phage protein (TIGR01671 family)
VREIKFRAWHKKEKKMYQVDDIMWNPQQRIWLNLKEDENDKGESINDVELMQYTGLKDVGGTEIYEGDVVEGIGGEHILGTSKFNVFGIVEFLSGSFILNEILNKSASSLQQLNLIMDLTVIGNIYENPELLGD